MHPGTKQYAPQHDDEDELVGRDATVYRALAARANYLAQDRSDIVYATKELTRQMSAPRNGDRRAMKRLARYLMKRPRVVTLYKYQTCNKFIDTWVGTDYAGCKRTRKSTSGGVIMLGEHVIKSWSTTQNVIALSSGEDEFYGRGVSTCATCDGFFYKDKPVTVLGGGDTALEEAFFLSNICSDVYVVHRRDEFRAAPPTLDRAIRKENIHLITDSVIEEAVGDAMGLSGVDIKNNDGSITHMDNTGLFVFVGHNVRNEVLKDENGTFICEMNDWGQVIVDLSMKTSVPGLFAAGDLRIDAPKQVVSAAGDGSVAALQVLSYIQELA